MSRAISPGPRTEPDDVEPQVFEFIWRRYRHDECDLLNGGIAPADVAEAGIAYRSKARRVCKQLHEQGYLVKLRGLNPECRIPRTSWAPAALHDGGDSA